MRLHWAMALAAVCLAAVCLAAGCAGKEEPRGIRGRVVGSSGEGIANATVSVVELPEGGIQELFRMVNKGESFWGWHFTTDSEGRFLLTGIPTGGLVPSRLVPHSYPNPTGAPPQLEFAFQPGKDLGLVVNAAGYQPHVALVNFRTPTGEMSFIRLVESGVGTVEMDKEGLKISLQRRGEQNCLSVDGNQVSDAGPEDAVRERTVRIPTGVLAQYTNASRVCAPSWSEAEQPLETGCAHAQ